MPCAAALAAAGADVELVTSRFGYGAEVPQHAGLPPSREAFYRWISGPPTRRIARPPRRAARPARARHASATRAGRAAADVVHFQWLAVQQLDARLLPRRRPRLLTAHDVLPREPRPGQLAGQRRLYERMDAVVVHSEHGAARLRDEVGLDPGRVHVIPHGAFHHLAAQPDGAPLPPELPAPRGPVVLCFGLMRPYKGIDVLLEAWRAAERPEGAELWIVGHAAHGHRGRCARPRPPASAGSPASSTAPSSRRCSARADAGRAARTARSTSPASSSPRSRSASPLLLTAVGGFPEVAADGRGRARRARRPRRARAPRSGGCSPTPPGARSSAPRRARWRRPAARTAGTRSRAGPRALRGARASATRTRGRRGRSATSVRDRAQLAGGREPGPPRDADRRLRCRGARAARAAGEAELASRPRAQQPDARASRCRGPGPAREPVADLAGRALAIDLHDAERCRAAARRRRRRRARPSSRARPSASATARNRSASGRR